MNYMKRICLLFLVSGINTLPLIYDKFKQPETLVLPLIYDKFEQPETLVFPGFLEQDN